MNFNGKDDTEAFNAASSASHVATEFPLPAHTVTVAPTVETIIKPVIVKEVVRKDVVTEIQPIITRHVDKPVVHLTEKYIYEDAPPAPVHEIVMAPIVNEVIHPHVINEVQEILVKEVSKLKVKHIDQALEEHVTLPTEHIKEVIDERSLPNADKVVTPLQNDINITPSPLVDTADVPLPYDFALEEAERERRLTDIQGEQLKRDLAKKVSGLLARPSFRYAAVDSAKLEEEERQRRMLDEVEKKLKRSIARTVSGILGLLSSPSAGWLEESEQKRRLADVEGEGIKRGLAKKVSSLFSSTSGRGAKINSAKLEEEERQRRMLDTEGEILKFSLAKKVSKELFSAAGSRLEERERESRLSDVFGEGLKRELAKKVSGIITLRYSRASRDYYSSKLLEEAERTRRFYDVEGEQIRALVGNKVAAMVKPDQYIPSVSWGGLAALEENERKYRTRGSNQIHTSVNAHKIAELFKASAAYNPGKYTVEEIIPAKHVQAEVVPEAVSFRAAM